MNSTITLGQAVDLIDSAFSNVVSDISLHDETIADITYSVNNALWIRDYLLGLPANNGLTNSIKFVNYLSAQVPAQDRFAYDTVNAIFQYEAGNKELSEHLIALASEVNPDYTLANLIKRVIQANWPSSEFTTMRSAVSGSIVEDINAHSDQIIAEIGA